ncbi:NlpC/P60 family protein [Nocardioides marmoriginsengisoli]|uniref:NlpC/P60 family protein n=1 Tax=Nocardioides marmoriginsengisoli TaxID=661483 RepID=A0A3N0CG60_9ACTN|nr:NlpC/P60 family protein [Nocardioides marmoriginsengisoli]
MASEAYNGAQWRLGEAKKATAAAIAAADAATERAATERSGLAALATASAHHGGALNGLTAFFAEGGPEEVMSEVQVAKSASDSIQARFEQFKASEVMAKTARTRAEEAQTKQAGLVREAAQLRDVATQAAQSAQRQASAIAVQRQQLISELAAAQKISVSLARRRQAGLEKIAHDKAVSAAAQAAAHAAAQQAEQAADQAAAGSGSNGGSGSSGAGSPGRPAVGTTRAAARAIEFARAQLGEPYVWAAAGPNSWDCSGLTMMAWRAGGVSLPHYSAAQYDETEHIGVTDLRPGDLVFWGDTPDTIHHVALYIGNGQILHAPRTGRDVSIDSMYYWIPPNYFGRP